MLEYIKFKRAKKHQDQSAEDKSPVLSVTDEQFLQQIVTEQETLPPLPERPSERVAKDSAGDLAGEARQAVLTENRGLQPEEAVVKEKKSEGEENAKKENKAWSFLQRSFSKKDKKKAPEVQADGLVTPNEAKGEEHDITIALEKLNLAAEGNSAFSLSKETRELVQKFTVILKDLVNGVPTAYDDLVELLDDSSGQLQKSYSKLPHYLQKLVTSLPSKLTSTVAPELLAAAAESQNLGAEAAVAAGGSGGLKAAVGKAALAIPSLKDLVTKPGAVIGMLKAIMNVLKLRWPAFIGTNVLWSLGLFILLFVFWYCHKRGKEVRLEHEKSEEDVRVEELAKGGEPSGSTPAAATPAAATPAGATSPGATPAADTPTAATSATPTTAATAPATAA
ncbi:MAG: hypothetical protein M1839_003714 [Geoglossum umbratile]|nr:MAG: hypothetical protein M1839_003714 [Geoglossum umbratile]